MTQDYERGLYYDQYVRRVAEILLGLFLDLERIHRRVFQDNFETDMTPAAVEKIVKGTLAGVRPTLCRYTHKHMRENKITPELWTLCESGNLEAVGMCPLWEGQRDAAAIGKP